MSMGFKIPAMFVEMADFFEPTKVFRDSGSVLRLSASQPRGNGRLPGGNPPVTTGPKKSFQRHYGGDFFIWNFYLLYIILNCYEAPSGKWLIQPDTDGLKIFIYRSEASWLGSRYLQYLQPRSLS